jgi:hypothetical protein
MKGIHIGCILLIVAAYVIGAMYPGLYNTVRSKIGG